MNDKKIDSQLYAALTRVRENLIVINQNKRYQKFGDENFNKREKANAKYYYLKYERLRYEMFKLSIVGSITN